MPCYQSGQIEHRTEGFSAQNGNTYVQGIHLLTDVCRKQLNSKTQLDSKMGKGHDLKRHFFKNIKPV